MAAPLLFAAAVALIAGRTPPAAAQPAAPEEETFFTADGVKLRGLFHATNKKPDKAPVVILMYAPGSGNDMTKGDWAALAKTLNAEGYHVFRFDWRGHGKSTDIKDPTTFWNNQFTGPINLKYVKGGPPKRPVKNDIFYKDLTNPAGYMPVYLNDLAAVRLHLDKKNDGKTINTSSIYLIGAESAATLGLAWLAAEWQRPATYPGQTQLGFVAAYTHVPQPLVGGFTEAGGDFSGAVWLSADRPNTAAIPEVRIKEWVSKAAPKIRENNPMLFLYADKDKAGKRQSEFFFNEVLVAAPRKGSALNPLDQTFIKEVAGGNQLSGVKLLGVPNLKTEDTIVKFLEAIQKQRVSLTTVVREYKEPYYIHVTSFGMRP
jgi:hypothetical protein